MQYKLRQLPAYLFNSNVNSLAAGKLPHHHACGRSRVASCSVDRYPLQAQLRFPGAFLLQATFPKVLVEGAGAPRAVWTEIRSKSNSSDMLVDVIWENKTATRLPETLWVRCAGVWVSLEYGYPLSTGIP